MIHSYEPNLSGHFYGDDGRTFKINDDGTEIEMTPSLCRKLVLSDGGTMHGDGLVFFIKDGLISSVGIHKPLFSQLHLSSEDDVIAVLGEPQAKHLGITGYEYFYPSRFLAVTLSESFSQLRFGQLDLPEDRADTSGEIVLLNYRSIQLIRLSQRRTYEGLLEGVPTRRFNQRKVQSTVEEVAKSQRFPVYLVPPKTRPIGTGKYVFGEKEALPAIECIGTFTSNAARDPKMDFRY